MEKRGVFELSFTYIFIVIVIVVILVFGFKAIGDIIHIGDQAELADFLNNLREKVNQYYYLDKGSTQKFELLTPSGIDYVCFLDTRNPGDFSNVPDGYIFNDVVFGGIDKELIILKAGKSFEKYSLDKDITVDDNPLCIKILDGRLKFRLTNTGTEVKVSS